MLPFSVGPLWAQWPMHNNDLGLLTGFRSVDLEKNRGIECLSACLLAISRRKHYGVSRVNLSMFHSLLE